MRSPSPRHRARALKLRVPRLAVVLATVGALAGSGVTLLSPAAEAAPSPSIVAKTTHNTAGRAAGVRAKPLSARGRLQLVLLVSGDGPSSTPQSVRSVRGCGRAWRLVARANREAGTAEVWRATTAHGVRRCAPYARLARSGYHATATLMAVSQGGIARVRAGSQRFGAASVSLPMATGSMAVAVGHDWDSATGRRVLPGQALVHQRLTSADDTMWVQRTGHRRSSGVVRVGTYAPRNDRWNLAAVELASSRWLRAHRRTATRPTTTPPRPVPSSPPTSSTPTPSTPKPSSPAPTPTTPTPTTPTPTQPETTPASGKPGPGNTGVPAGVTLSAVKGGLTVTQDNAVIDAKDISGPVTIAAKNVTIKRSKIHGTAASDYGVYVRSGSVSISDTEIWGFQNGIAFDNWTATRVNLHGMTDDGTKLGSNVTLQDSWIHDMTPSAGAHADGGQMQGGSRNLVVRHNVIDMVNGRELGNAALFIAPDLGPSSDGPVTIANNWLNGGNYTVYCVDGDNGRYFVKNIAITGNRFGRQSNYGPATVNVPITQSGNVWDDTGAALRVG
jgi:hypothetical protein